MSELRGLVLGSSPGVWGEGARQEAGGPSLQHLDVILSLWEVVRRFLVREFHDLEFDSPWLLGGKGWKGARTEVGESGSRLDPGGSCGDRGRDQHVFHGRATGLGVDAA